MDCGWQLLSEPVDALRSKGAGPAPGPTPFVVPKQVLSLGLQETNLCTEWRDLIYLQFCTERRLGGKSIKPAQLPKLITVVGIRH